MRSRFILFVFLLSSPSLLAAASGFQLLQRTPNAIRLEWTSPPLDLELVRAGGREWVTPVMNGLLQDRWAGYPILPMDYYFIEISEGTFRVLVTDSMTTSAPVAALLPAPSFLRDVETAAEGVGPVFRPDPTVYDQAGPYPASFVSVQTARMREKTYLRVSIHPVKYNPAQGTLHHLRYIRLHIQRTKATSVPAEQTSTSALPVAFEDGQMVKLLNTEEGIYAVSGADLQDLGIEPENISPSSVKIFHKDQEIPCLVLGGEDGVLDPEDRIVYFAERLHGEEDYFHAYTDTNVYRLTWGGSDGRRFRSRPSLSPESPVRDHFKTVRHLEKDIEYYHGDRDADIHETFPVPGEGWVWTKSLYAGMTFRVSFDLPGLNRLSDSVVVRLRLRGTTYAPQSPDHHVRLVINGSPVHEVYFNDTEEVVPEFAVPVSILSRDENQLEIESLNDLGADRSKILFDWVEFTFSRKLEAANGWLRFSADEAAEPGTFHVTGFQSDSVWVLNLSKGEEIVPAHVDRRHRYHVRVVSGGFHDGNLAHFYFDEQLQYAGTRGISLVVIDPESGQVLSQRSFDTYRDRAQADSMAWLITQLPEGTIVLAAVRDEGSAALTDSARAALETLGSGRIRELSLRDSWALIGLKGASPGSVPEALSPRGSGAAELEQDFSFPRGGESFTVVFADSALIGSDYALFEPRGFRRPLRLVRDVPGHLLSPDNGADYIIITHPAFLTQAEELARHRQSTNGFRTRVVLVEDIYDEFNFGIADPEAIRRFLQFAYHSWQGPAPQYLLLFGDATWDPKRNIKNATKIDFVPTLGNPVSDLLFACLDGPDDLLPELSVGRIPVENASQAEAVVEKIKVYDATPSEAWKKRFVFINGGFEELEQKTFVQQSEKLIRDFVQAPPTAGQASLINKESQGYQEGEHRDDIINAFDRGAVWVNFIGHAGSRTWDLMFHNSDIEDLRNGPYTPFISSMTCHTGRFAEPNQTSFGENFLLVPSHGAIAFWGTSGWGYSYEDYIYLRKLFPIVLQDTVHTLGDAITRAKFAMWKAFGPVPHIRDLILQYNLLGDPALDLALPEKPDLAIRPLGLSVHPLLPNEADSVATVSVRVHNFGLVPQDSVAVELSASHLRWGRRSIGAGKLAPVGFLDSLSFRWPLRDMAGSVELEAAVDPENAIAEADENNNVQKTTVTVLSGLVKIESPPDQSMVPAKEPALKILNPQTEQPEPLTFEFQIDTTSSFDSDALRSWFVPSGRVITRWQPGNLRTGQWYFWRCRNTSDPQQAAWVGASFYTLADSGFGWRQSRREHFLTDSLDRVEAAGRELRLAKNPLSLYVESAGLEDGNFARVIINGEAMIEPRRGHNVVILDGRTGSVTTTESFDTYADATAPGRLAQLINEADPRSIFLIAIKDEGSNQMNEEAYLALESIGSAKCRLVGRRDSWAIIGRKGAPPGTVPESYSPRGNGSATVTDTLDFFHLHGRVRTPRIGPTRTWRTLSYQAEIPQPCSFSLTLLGYHRMGGRIDSLAQFSAPGDTLDLSFVDADSYPYLSLLADLATSDASYSPHVKNWQLRFEPSPDLVIGPEALAVSQDTVLVGETLTLSLEVFNAGLRKAENVLVRFEETDPVKGKTVFAEQKVAAIAADSSYALRQTWSSAGKVGRQRIYISVDPQDGIPELDESNNSLTAQVVVQPDTIQPQLEITFDGQPVAYGDLVASHPTIIARILDNSPLAISDTSQVQVHLDGRALSFAAGEVELSPMLDAQAAYRALVRLTPELGDGSHVLEFFVSDASGNRIYERVDFRVVGQLKLEQVLNYPNPMKDGTEFSFLLTQPARVDIKIFTVAGRLIRYLEAGWYQPGFRLVRWDGRDADGDRLANGIYIYKIIARGESEQAEAISKIIVMN